MLSDHGIDGGRTRRSVLNKRPQRMDVQGARPRELILTMLVSFSLTFAISMRERKTTAAPPRTLVSQPISSHPTPEQPKLVERTPAAAPAPPRPASASEAAPGTGPQGGALPLAYNVYNRRNHGKIEGFITNMSDQPMSVSLQVMDAAGQPTTQAELNLAPAEQRGFGTDFGLDLHSRDRVILHSPPYQDGSMEVP